jgi:hypothetical protein
VEIVVCNYVFFEDPQSIFHTIPLLVIETTYALKVFPLLSKPVGPTSNFDMGFLQALHSPIHCQDYLLFVFQSINYRNPSLGLPTKARGCKVAG